MEIDNIGIIDECIKKARFGGLIFAGQEILLPKSSNLNTILYPFYHPDINFGPRLPCLSLHGSGVSELLQSLDEINWDLKMAEQPFYGLDGLLAYLGSQRLEFGKATGLEIVARTPVAIIMEDSKIYGEGKQS